MKEIHLLNERQLIKKGVAILMRDLGPMETTRFLSLLTPRRGDSVRRHRRWQAGLDKERFFKEIFSAKS